MSATAKLATEIESTFDDVHSICWEFDSFSSTSLLRDGVCTAHVSRFAVVPDFDCSEVHSADV